MLLVFAGDLMSAQLVCEACVCYCVNVKDTGIKRLLE